MLHSLFIVLRLALSSYCHLFYDLQVCFEVHVLEKLPVTVPGTETNPHVVRVGWSVDEANLQVTVIHDFFLLKVIFWKNNLKPKYAEFIQEGSMDNKSVFQSFRFFSNKYPSFLLHILLFFKRNEHLAPNKHPPLWHLN